MNARRDFLFLVALAATVTPALGQTGAPIPNFAGLWYHPTSPGFEPLPSGPSPIMNKSRRRDGKGNFNQLVGDYSNPILKPNAAEVVKQYGDISLKGIG